MKFGVIIDGLVKSLKKENFVIPAQAGIQYFQIVRIPWIPVFTGMTTFYEIIIIGFYRYLRGWKAEGKDGGFQF